MPTTVRSIVDQCIYELSQIPGVSTEVYAVSRLTQHVEDAFFMVWEKHRWAAYGSWWTGTLDGTTGRLTADIIPQEPVPTATRSIPITSYDNIKECFPANTNRIIRQLPPRHNPYTYSGGIPMYREASYQLPNRPIKFYPIDSTGQIVMRVYQEPIKPFALTDLIYIDSLMLAYGACYFYAADDASNPAAITKFQQMFIDRTNTMINAENDVVLALDPRPYAEGITGNDEQYDPIGFFTIGESEIA